MILLLNQEQSFVLPDSSVNPLGGLIKTHINRKKKKKRLVYLFDELEMN